MKIPISKKNFCVNGVCYTLVYASRAYIEYYELKGTVRVRRKIYGGINRIKDDAEKFTFAIDYIQKKYAAEYNIQNSVLLKALDNDKENLRLKTYKTYKVKLVHWLNWLHENKYNEFTVNDSVANEYIQYLRSKKLAGKTIKSYYTAIKCVYAKADIYPFTKKIKIAYTSTSLSHFDYEQSNNIINYAKEHYYPLYLGIKFLFHCFIRPGEMRLLKFENIDFENNVINIPAHISKNKKSQTVVIPNQFAQELRQYSNIDKGMYLLGSKKIGNEMPIKSDFLNKTHKKVLAFLNIKGKYAFYSWKHTGVIRAVRAGINIKDIQLQLRHHSLDMVNEYLKNLGVIDSEDLRDKMPVL